jgi:hypothetical protein
MVARTCYGSFRELFPIPKNHQVDHGGKVLFEAPTMAQTVYQPLKRALGSLSVLVMLKVAIKQLPNPGNAIETDGTRIRGRFCLIVQRFCQRLDQKQTKKEQQTSL